MSEAIENQNEFSKLNSLSEVVWCVVIVCTVKLLFGGAWALMGRHSCGENLDTMYSTMLTPRKLSRTQSCKNIWKIENKTLRKAMNGMWIMVALECLIFYLITTPQQLCECLCTEQESALHLHTIVK
jgi:hypothetical protein